MTGLPRFLQLPKGNVFLFGPRGTGKSTWLRRVLPDAVRIDLLEPAELRRYLARPESLREIVSALQAGASVIIDEFLRALKPGEELPG
ncbi:MAG: hypothetical protein GF331_26110 [Chitinivibrionales bacterium]|nr:hypothetical protein [Chitinivibrionales bacterium]